MIRRASSLLKEIVDLSHLSVQRGGVNVTFLPSKQAVWKLMLHTSLLGTESTCVFLRAQPMEAVLISILLPPATYRRVLLGSSLWLSGREGLFTVWRLSLIHI